MNLLKMTKFFYKYYWNLSYIWFNRKLGRLFLQLKNQGGEKLPVYLFNTTKRLGKYSEKTRLDCNNNLVL